MAIVESLYVFFKLISLDLLLCFLETYVMLDIHVWRQQKPCLESIDVRFQLLIHSIVQPSFIHK